MSSLPEQNVVSDYYDNYKETQAYIFKTEARKTRNMIFTVAAILFISDFIGLSMANVINVQTILMILLFPAIYIFLGFLALKQPLIAIVISLMIFAAIVILSFVAFGSVSLISGIIVKAILVFCLLAGLSNAREAEKARKEMH